MTGSSFRVFAVGLAVFASVCAGEPAVYEGDGWSFTVPDGWEPISDEALGLMNEMFARVDNSGKMWYEAGFVNPETGLDGRYVLVQFNDRSFRSLSEDELRGAFGAMGTYAGDISKTLQEKTDGLVTDFTLDKASYDPDRRRVLVPGAQQVDGVPMRFLLVMHPGRDAGVQLNWYAPAADFGAAIPVFMASADTFAWAPGHAWEPAAGRGTRVVRQAIIGAAVGAVGAVVLGIFRKRKRASEITR